MHDLNTFILKYIYVCVFILQGRVFIVHYSIVFIGFYTKFGKNQAEVVEERLPQYYILNHLKKDRGRRL